MSYQRMGVPTVPVQRRSVLLGPPAWAPASGYRRGMRGLAAFDYSAVTDCAMLTPWQQSQDPNCGGSQPSSGYVAPTLLTPSSCVDPASGMPLSDPSCVLNNLKIQATNQAAIDSANRAVFLQDCHAMIAAENASRASRGLPLEVDDCDQRTFGQTLPGTTGGAVQPQLTPSYVSAPAPSPAPAAAPSGGSSAPASSSAAAGSSAPSGSQAAGYVSATDVNKLTNANGINIAGFDVPWWALAAGAAGLFFLAKGR